MDKEQFLAILDNEIKEYEESTGYRVGSCTKLITEALRRLRDKVERA